MQAEEFTHWIGIIVGLAAAIMIVYSIVIWSIRNGISPMPSSLKARKFLLISLPDELRGIVYELGSGWGTLVFPLAKKYPDCQVIGYELSPIPFFFSKVRQKLAFLANLRIERCDFFTKDLRNASLVVCYLYPGAMRRLKEKFEKELSAGTWVASNTFSIPGWTPEAVYEVGDLYRSKIYLYRIP